LIWHRHDVSLIREFNRAKMKVLLQNVETKLFFSVLGGWTDNANLAYHFKHSEQALAFARKNNLSMVQVVLKFDDPQWRDVVQSPLLVASLPSQSAAS
jgi:hypothetical protein